MVLRCFLFWRMQVCTFCWCSGWQYVCILLLFCCVCLLRSHHNLWHFVNAPNKIFWIVHVYKLFMHLLPFTSLDNQEFTVLNLLYKVCMFPQSFILHYMLLWNKFFPMIFIVEHHSKLIDQKILLLAVFTQKVIYIYISSSTYLYV
jgi:hypothetical protein